MTTKNQANSPAYQAAGVNIDRGNALVSRIKGFAKSTRRAGVMDDIGGFGALFQVPKNYQEPILVSGTDGVGTKLKLAIELNQHAHIGIDLVAMCVNDIVTLGAEPLFFLDYFATGQLELEQASTIIESIATGCRQAGCALIGGETAEMPGLYAKDDYDLAGFCVGVVEKSKIINGAKIQAGQTLIALPSSGVHANGFSLVRKILSDHQQSLDQSLQDNKTLGEILLQPTRIYVKAILALQQKIDIFGIAHITGGGLTENIPRILPENLQAVINTSSWQWPEIFSWLQKTGKISTDEMRRVFNLGVGMIICVNSQAADSALKILSDLNEPAWVIGHIAAAKNDSAITFVNE